MSKPEDVNEVKSLLGMAQYVSRYISDYATITAPLRLLTRKETPWQWTNEQQRAFDKLKDTLIESHVKSFFNPRLKTEVIVDAIPVGLGCLLVQDGRVIRYASRELSDVEQRYSQGERECREWFGPLNTVTFICTDQSSPSPRITNHSYVSLTVTTQRQPASTDGS